MGVIDELHKKSIQLQEIPGFMTIHKVKPKLSKKNKKTHESLKYMVQLKQKKFLTC